MARVNRTELGSASSPMQVLPADYALTDFGQMRVASPRRLLDLTMIDEINADVVSTSATGVGASATHDANSSSIHLQVGAAAGNIAVVTTSYQRYTAGAAQRILGTGWLEVPLATNQRLRIGYFDANDGLFFEATTAGVKLVRRSSVTGTPTDSMTQDADLALSALNYHSIFEIRFRYLGHGPARFYVNTVDVGQLVFEPEVGPFMRSARLPLRVELENTGGVSGPPAQFHFQCASVESEGGSPEPMRTFSTGQAVTSVTTAETGLLAIRLSALYQTQVNRGQVLPLLLSLGSETQRGRFTLRWKPTLLLPDASWTAVDASSRVERRSALTGGSAPSAFGIPLASFFIPSGGGESFDIRELFDPSARILQLDPLTNAAGVLLVTGQNEGAATTNQFASLTWGERN